MIITLLHVMISCSFSDTCIMLNDTATAVQYEVYIDNMQKVDP